MEIFSYIIRKRVDKKYKKEYTVTKEVFMLFRDLKYQKNEAGLLDIYTPEKKDFPTIIL